MFDVPFLHGNAWDEAADRDGAFVVVISRELSERLYGDTDPTGRSLRIDDRDYRVSGVIDHWRPVPKFYRIRGGGAISDAEDLFVPFRNAIAREWNNNGWTNCSGGRNERGQAPHELAAGQLPGNESVDHPCDVAVHLTSTPAVTLSPSTA